MKGSRLRNKFKFKPLPLVPCKEFKGLGGKAKRNIAMMQIFASLFQLLQFSYANRAVPLFFHLPCFDYQEFSYKYDNISIDAKCS